MRYVIIGRVGTDQRKLAGLLAERGLRAMRSYTTRPKRSESEDSYDFVTPEAAEKIEAKVLRTDISGYEFFTTREEVEKADVMAVDPVGLRELGDLLPDENIHIVHVVSDDMERKLNDVRQADDKIREEHVFDDRDMNEDEAFSVFEEDLAGFDGRGADGIPGNVTCVMTYHNEFRDGELADYADYLFRLWKQNQRLTGIVRESVRLGFVTEEDGKVVVYRHDGDDPEKVEKKLVSYSRFADTLLGDDEGMARLMSVYVARSDRFSDLD